MSRILSSIQQKILKHFKTANILCRWREQTAAIPHCQGRQFKCMATNAIGASCLLPRYVAPALLPFSQTEDVTSLEELMQRLARIVSLVPLLGSAFQQLHPKMVVKCVDMIRLAAGGHVEHGLLLAGYFLKLGQEVWTRAEIEVAILNSRGKNELNVCVTRSFRLLLFLALQLQVPYPHLFLQPENLRPRKNKSQFLIPKK